MFGSTCEKLVMNWGQSVRKRAAELALSAGAGETTSQQPETKRKRGRPEGTYGSREMRALLQQAREQPQAFSVDEVIPILDNDDDDNMEENHGANLSLRSLSSRAESASSKLSGSHFQTLGRMLLLMFQ